MLLELPSSKLIGWMFGDLGAISFLIDRNDLKEANFERVWADFRN
ncbi:MAG: DUF1963 domain-containing protein [Boseongicola sp.]|nr:DUF1963 domain-containing protein [Boseongicola sp.]